MLFWCDVVVCPPPCCSPQVIKKTKAAITQRLVPPAAVASWQARIEGAAADVTRVYDEEREEKELRQAEMETTKMQVGPRGSNAEWGPGVAALPGT